MSVLRQHLSDYLAMRRSLGFRLEREEKLLPQFIDYLEELGEKHVTTRAALDWARLPSAADRSWWSARLTIVRGFARHLFTVDPATEVPGTDLLPWKRCRATPYLYSNKEIAALIAATGNLRPQHRAATYRTLIGLLAVTGMRVGEAIGLDRDDFDAPRGLVTIRRAKFDKSREIPLHISTVDALRDYLRRKDRPTRAAKTNAFLVSNVGTRLLYPSVVTTFHGLLSCARIGPRTDKCRPRLHDLRHSFAVKTLLDAYRNGLDTQLQITLLSTYLGHVDPSSTYWYLSAAPELLQLAGERLEQHLGGVR